MRQAYSFQAARSIADDFGLKVDFRRNGQSRHLVVGRKATIAAGAVLLALTAWALAAAFYMLFHDDLLASLMRRQADMQYAYEDQIEALRTEVGREASRGLIDQHTIRTTMRDLADQAARLEARAAALQRLVDESGPTSPPFSKGKAADPRWADGRPEPATGLATSPPPGPLRGRPGDRAGLTTTAPLFQRLAAVEQAQVGTLARLQEPVLRRTRRLAAALSQVGVSDTSGGNARGGVGGPFIPLDLQASPADFDQQVALAHATLEERNRLSALADHVPLGKPLSGALDVSSPFGVRLDPFLGRPALHSGVDLLQSEGDAVYATAAGTVTAAGLAGGYGEMVEIDHGNGLVTRYGHLSAIDVVPHQFVAAGAVVGRVGATGRATGRHLHYETRVNGQPVDPVRFLRAGLRLAAE